MAIVRLISLMQLEKALKAYSKESEKAAIRGLRKAGRFGHTATIRTYTRTRDPFRIRASGSYGQAWLVRDIPDGSMIANAIFYSVFVERGRRPGKPPPLKPILEWVYQKRLSARPKPLIRGARVRRNRKEFIGPKKPTKAQREAADFIGPREPKRRKYGPRPSKEKRRKFALRTRLRARRQAIKTATAIAQKVRWKIAKHGTKGRWVLRRTMPQIAKRVRRDVQAELTKLSRNPPRG